MARNGVTVIKLSTANSSTPKLVTMQAVDTDTGCYIDCNNIDASKVILVVTMTDSGANTASANNIEVQNGGANSNYSNRTLGDLAIDMSSAVVCTRPATAMTAVNAQFVGPFETARFKDSQGYINVNCTNGTNIAAIGAIFIGP